MQAWMRRAVVVAAIGATGAGLMITSSAGAQIPPPPTLPPGFTLPTFPPPPTLPPFPTIPPPTMPPPTQPPPTQPPPTMPPFTQPTSPPPTLPPFPNVSPPSNSQINQDIQSLINDLGQFGDRFQDAINDLKALQGRL